MVIADYYERITGAAPNYADAAPNFVRNLFVVYKGMDECEKGLIVLIPILRKIPAYSLF